jgi:predicted nucleotidyltransferase
MVEILKKDQRCKGGWHYGSVSRWEIDEFSDYDPVFLVADKDFEDFSKDVSSIVSSICDELLISWPESYNSPYFKNFCNLIRNKNDLHQLDFFILNSDFTENWWCRQHLKGCTRANLIFDRTGEVGALLDKGLRTDNDIPDARRCIDTYWFHGEMLIKYFRREDIFKLIKNIDILFHAHVDLLLSGYDTLDWGAWETKVKKCVPTEQQAHLLVYFTEADFKSYAEAIKKCMINFDEDAKSICRNKGIEYPKNVANQVIEYFNREVQIDTLSKWV